MLEEAADDGADADALAESLDAGAEGAHAADDEVDGDAGLGGGVHGLDALAVEQRVHLGDDAGGAAGAGVLRLTFDETQEIAGEGERARP